eukprot:9174-Heterococcus_DN1.PRE.1
MMLLSLHDTVYHYYTAIESVVIHNACKRKTAVYEGEYGYPLDNQLIGRFSLSSLSPDAPAGYLQRRVEYCCRCCYCTQHTLKHLCFCIPAASYRVTVQTAATPRIAVTFDVNTNGDLKVQAVELVSEGGKMEETEETETEETETAMEVTAEEVTAETEGVQPVPPEQAEVPTVTEAACFSLYAEDGDKSDTPTC